MKFSRVVAPVGLPTSVEDCKQDLRVFGTDDDVYINTLIEDATEHVDGAFGLLNRALLTQDWTMTTDRFQIVYELPLAPVQSIQSIEYYDADNEVQQYDEASYILFADVDGAKIEIAETATFPTVYDRPDAVTITFRAGYGDSASDIPKPIVRAIRLLVAHWFDNPTASTAGAMSTTPHSIDALLAQYRRGVVG